MSMASPYMSNDIAATTLSAISDRWKFQTPLLFFVCFLLFFWFLAVPKACGNSWARNWTQAQQWPKPLQWQHWTLNPVHHRRTSNSSAFNFQNIQPYYAVSQSQYFNLNYEKVWKHEVRLSITKFFQQSLFSQWILNIGWITVDQPKGQIPYFRKFISL